LFVFVGEFADDNVAMNHCYDNTSGHRRRSSVRYQDVAMSNAALVQGVSANPDRIAAGTTQIENSRKINGAFEAIARW
jgi:hypothetical protein